MTDKLPGGARPSDRDESIPINETISSANGFVTSSPEISGIHTQVQHPLTGGEPCQEYGMAGLGIAQTPIGPILMLQLLHADGTSLSAMMTVDEVASFSDLLAEAMKRVLLIGATDAGSIQ